MPEFHLLRPIQWTHIAEVNAEEEPAWLWQNILLHGHVTLLTAGPKVGKTTCACRFLASLYMGVGQVYGRAIARTALVPTYYMTEESKELWARRKSWFPPDSPIYLAFRHEERRPWHEIVGVLRVDIPDGAILVLDTLSAWWSVPDENETEAVKQAFQPLIHLTREKHLATLVLHHVRKDLLGSEGIERVRGSSVLTAESDIIANLLFRGQQRVLRIISRWGEDLLIVGNA